jgi:hypothetical protein
MAKFVFKGEAETVYVDVADSNTGGTLLAIPGETYNLTEAPDDLFVAESKKTAPAADPTEEVK